MKLLKALSASVLLAASSSAFALPSINGDITFVLGGYFIDDTNTPTTIDQADGIVVDGNGPGSANPGTPNTAIVASADGTFAAEGVAAGNIAAFKDFMFNPFSPVVALWSVGGFTFDLNNATYTQGIDGNGNGYLNVTGTGVVKHANYDDTIATWTFSSSDSAPVNLRFSSHQSTTGAVPAPALLGLVGLGLVGVGVSRRFRKA